MSTTQPGFCPRCGREVPERVEITYQTIKRRCPNCGAIHYGLPEKRGRARACSNCECLYNRKTWEVMPTEEWEKLPMAAPCRVCQLELSMMEEVVRKGGVYWRCAKCGNCGVIAAENELAKTLRKASKTPAPEAIGIELDPEQCPVCSGKINKEEQS